jgi:UDP-N-acetylmuramate: L-alanyl-gamma-D-glutamyl-meso-diaminopimelate ligase
VQNFKKEYQGALGCRCRSYFYLTSKIKQLEEGTHDQISESFQREDLIIFFTNPKEFKARFYFHQKFLDNQPYC